MDSGPAPLSLQQWFVCRGFNNSRRPRSTGPIPPTSQARRQQSFDDAPLDISQLFAQRRSNDDGPQKTVLYLGYGSNLSAETFRGKRNIKPLSQINVVVPSLSLTFDLPGIPYSEPCFGNVRYRDMSAVEEARGECETEGYNKDRWRKGLVGVVYEVTQADFIHIIATEGGGSGYQDVLVDCYALSGDPTEDVPAKPSGNPFKAHTLFAPSRVSRPNHSYAQPSPRYLKLITDGALEHALPLEYQAFLHQIRTYHLTTTRQQLGSFIFLAVWSPFFLFLVGGAGIFLQPDGRYPKWLAKFFQAMFTACWASYDGFFRKTFGDGERTIGDEEDDGADCILDEKQPLLEQELPKYGSP